MYPNPFYNTGGANPMWFQMPPGFSPMPDNCPGGDCGGVRPQGGAQNNQNFGFPPAQNYPFPGFGPSPSLPPPDFGFYQ